jgi:hypothetical protein
LDKYIDIKGSLAESVLFYKQSTVNPVAALEGGFTRIFLPTRQRVGGGTGGVAARFETVYPKMASVKFSTVFADPKLADDSITTLSNPKLPTDVYVDGVFSKKKNTHCSTLTLNVKTRLTLRIVLLCCAENRNDSS